MNSDNLYETITPSLTEIIDALGGGNQEGATYLLPDLQRGFVWTPAKMESLLDTIIKGWPFGSILLAEIGERALAFSPRCFYGKVYCGSERKVAAEQLNVSLNRSTEQESRYTLVLDGQQRLQSLLLCFGAHVSGVVMTEKDWLLYNGNKHKRKPKDTICPECYLAIEAKNLFQHLQDNNFDLNKLEFSSLGNMPILTWIASSSPTHAYGCWINQLPRVKKEILKQGGRPIRLSALWRIAAEDSKELETFYKTYGIETKDEQGALNLFVKRLRIIRDLHVNCLCLKSPQDDDDASWEAYNEMILDVFTRLNAGGMELSKEDITLSWLKRHWIVTESNSRKGKDAQQCMTNLRIALSEGYGISLQIDKLMELLTGIWACFEKKGQYITNNDLMNGELLKKIAVWLSTNWVAVTESIQSIAKSLSGRGLKFGVHYGSWRILAMLSAWNLAGRLWYFRRGVREQVNVETGFNEVLIGELTDRVDRLLFSGIWANEWSSSERMKAVADMTEKLFQVQTVDEAKKLLVDCLDGQMAKMCKKAIPIVEALPIVARNGVSMYKSYLWVWQRLNTERAKYSVMLVRERGGMEEGFSHVDHCLSRNYWEKVVLPKFGVEKLPSKEYANVESQINQIGNCALLLGALNISKSDREGEELEAFLGKAVNDVNAFLAALGIDRLLLYPARATQWEDLVGCMQKRTQLIKRELISFLEGKIRRILDANA